MQGNLYEAEECFKSALETDPNNSEILNDLGVVYFKKGDLKKAEYYFSMALKKNHLNLDALQNLADLYETTGENFKSITYLQKILGITGDETKLLNRLAALFKQTGYESRAIKTLKESLRVDVNQDEVKKLIHDLEQKSHRTGCHTQEKALNILFVQESPCIRNYKMARALSAKGHKVSLAYTKFRLSQMYKGLSDDVYHECIQLQSHRQLWDISKNYDIVHCHNEPDVLTVVALACDAPVVHDTHDLISLRANGDRNLVYFEGIANRGASGRVYSTPYQMEEARKLYGVSGPSLVLYNYASEYDLPTRILPKLSANDGRVHIVYEGGIGGNAHRNFIELFVQLAKKGIYIHIYPTFYDPKLARLFSEFPEIHYNKPASPGQIIEIMTQFDFGIIPFDLTKGNKRFLDSTIANKLFEYLAAGLAVIASPLKSYTDYFRENPVGITFCDTQDIIRNIPKLKEISENTDFSKQIFVYEREVEKLEAFYEEVISKKIVRPKFQRAGHSLDGNPLPLPAHISDDVITKAIKDDTTKESYNDSYLFIKTDNKLNQYNYEQYFRAVSQDLDLDDLVIRNTPYRPLLDLTKTQWLSTEELKAIQNGFLRMLVMEAYEKVPYYRKTMDAAGIDPEKVYTIEDLKDLPILNKEIIHSHYKEMQHVEIEKLEKYFTATGGSTGAALKYFVPPEVYYYGFGCRNRGFSWAGFSEDKDRIAYLAGGSLGVTDKVIIEKNKIKIPATGITNRSVMSKYYEALETFSPEYMRAYPSALFEFCKFLREEGKRLHIRAAITTGETLFEYQRSFIEETLECEIFNEYGAYDGGAGAFECEKHIGLHLQMERGIMELLDDDGMPAKPGKSGRIVVTDLHNYIFPFIRYDVGDIATASSGKCTCGRGLENVKRIEGRASDYIILKDGTRVSGESVIHLFNRLLQSNQIDIRQYQVHQKVDQAIEIKVIPGAGYSSTHRDRIYSVFIHHLGRLPVKVVEVDKILPAASGKMRFVYSDIKNSKIDSAETNQP